MRDYSIDLKFKANDSLVGKTNLESTLALVNNTNISDEKASQDVTKFLDAYNLDFHSDDKDVPQELPALYGKVDQGKTQLTIYSPREGYIKNVTSNPKASKELRESIVPEGKDDGWMYFSSDQTNYAVNVQ